MPPRTIPRRDFIALTLAAPTALFRPNLPRASSDEPTAIGQGGPLLVHSDNPLNAEPRLPDLVANWITPVEQFFVRNHGPMPSRTATTDQLAITGLVAREYAGPIHELLGRFPRCTHTATLACAGNRRAEMAVERPIPGVPWQAGAVGNAHWSGVRLRDVLQHLGLAAGVKHVWFEGMDRHDVDGETTAFGGSIPVQRIMDSTADGEVLLATHMNHCPLTPEHGSPLRVIVPGYIGARSVKWLAKIVLSDRPSPNHYLADSYRLPQGDPPTDRATPIYELPLQSAFTQDDCPITDAPGEIVLCGYAHPSGQRGRTIARVELSCDGGESWTAARLNPMSQPFCWRLWSATLHPRVGGDRIWARAIESDGTIQPARSPWNAKGYLFHAWPSLKLADTTK